MPDLDAQAMAAARTLIDGLAKPTGSLGRLEDLAVQLAGIAGSCPPPMPEPVAIAVFAGDHGVVESGVTPWPQATTGLMVRSMVAGGAAISVLARQLSARLEIVDVGVAGDVADVAGIRHAKVRAATRDLAHEAALTVNEVDDAMTVGRAVASDLVAAGARMLVTGDMGIGNTTASAAVIAALTGRSAAECTGRGTGISDEMLDHKTRIVERAIARVGELDGRSVLAEVGGLEIAALAGFVIEGTEHGVPVVIDGVIALAALCAAESIAPGVRHGCIAGHRSAEPGARVALGHLGLEPLLDLGMRLGEGSGAALAVPLVIAAAALTREMASL